MIAILENGGVKPKNTKFAMQIFAGFNKILTAIGTADNKNELSDSILKLFNSDSSTPKALSIKSYFGFSFGLKDLKICLLDNPSVCLIIVKFE